MANRFHSLALTRLNLNMSKSNALLYTLTVTLVVVGPPYTPRAGLKTVFKFAAVPKKDSAEFQRQLRDEQVAYDKLHSLTGWAIPRCYGLYSWYGGLSPVLPYEGPSLPKLKIEKFTSLGLTERCDSLPFRRECF